MIFRHVSDEALHWIRASDASQRPIGDASILAMIERSLNLPASFHPHG